MNAEVQWENLGYTGAFLLGAILATIAVLRVVRAVSGMFEDVDRRRRRRPPVDDDEDDA